MECTILHNPRCGKSRNALKLLHEKGENVQVVEYLKKTPSFEELKKIISMTGLKPEMLLRKKETIYKEHYKDKELTDDEVIQAMIDHPILIERPIVIKDKKATLGRDLEVLGKFV